MRRLAPGLASASRRAALCVLLLAAVSPAPVRAAGVVLGLGAGVAVPLGRIGGTFPPSTLSDEVSLALPLRLEVGVPVVPGLLVGLYGQYAPAKLSERAPLRSGACAGFGASCSGASDRRLGLALEFRPAAARGAWIGAAVGYEWLRYGIRDTSGAGSLGYRGWEATLQGGADFAIAPGWSLGPVAGVTLGRFDVAWVSQGGETVSGSIAQKRLHGWLTLGARLRLEL